MVRTVFAKREININKNKLAGMRQWFKNERKSEQAHIPHAPTLLENAVYKEWQFQALMTGNRTENQK